MFLREEKEKDQRNFYNSVTIICTTLNLYIYIMSH